MSEILRRYDRDELRAEIHDERGNIRARVVCRYGHRECPAIDKAFPTLTEAERWIRRILNLDEIQSLELPW